MDPFQQAMKALEELEDVLLERVAMAWSDSSRMEAEAAEAFFSPEEVEALVAEIDLSEE